MNIKSGDEFEVINHPCFEDGKRFIAIKVYDYCVTSRSKETNCDTWYIKHENINLIH